MAAGPIPHFIIIGAVKGATTWSARALASHPSIFIPGPEPHYFSSAFDKGEDWYLSLFAKASGDAVIGEKSADYFAHPEAAARIAAFAPKARLIVQLRSPVERAYSDYCMLYRRGTVREAPTAYFSPRKSSGESERFLTGGLYADHLKRFYDRFEREQILVVLYDDIMTGPTAVFNRILAHVGLPPDAAEVSAERQNDSAAPLLPLSMRRVLKPLKNFVRPLRGKSWFENVRGVFAREVAYPPLDDRARAFLVDFYREDIAALENMIGRNLDHWRRPAPTGQAASSMTLKTVVV